MTSRCFKPRYKKSMAENVASQATKYKMTSVIIKLQGKTCEIIITEVFTMKNTKNNITELVFILDKSGSMCDLVEDTIGGFNSLIEKQKAQEDDCKVTTVLFDNTMSTVHDRVSLDEVEPMTDDDYVPFGCTALIDAIGSTVEHIEKIHKYARREDVPESTMFVIITDGLENASHIYSSGKVKKMIEKRKEKDGWEFLFIGANIDSVETARGFGINEDRAIDYRADHSGTKVVYETVSKAVGCMRASRPLQQSWSEDIERDYKSR